MQGDLRGQRMPGCQARCAVQGLGVVVDADQLHAGAGAVVQRQQFAHPAARHRRRHATRAEMPLQRPPEMAMALARGQHGRQALVEYALERGERAAAGLVGDQAMGPFGVQAAIQQQEAAQFGLGQPKQQFDLARHVETGQIALQEDALAGLAHHAGQIGRRRAMGDERGWGHGWPDKKNRRMNAGRGCYEGKPE
ncbi:Uncharacterised protein [Bordetella pertussis]|nr:Uncharacterised protein [Bordetella pertussis]